jgi:hypothetical protein
MIAMESLFLILCGVILLSGILYWFWSHLQLTQKKVQLLENVVFELRGLVGDSPGFQAKEPATATVPTPYNDLTDDDWEDTNAQGEKEVSLVSTPIESILEPLTVTELPAAASSASEKSASSLEAATTEQLLQERESADREFRSFFVASETASEKPASVTGDLLESMTVKDLRRLGEQRGISGVSKMNKKELLAVLRQPVAERVSGGLDLIVETVDVSSDVTTTIEGSE